MGFNERTDRAGIVDSCQDLLRFQAMFSRHFVQGPRERFGDPGEAAIDHALTRYGQYRGAVITRKLRATGRPLSARALIDAWDTADYALLVETGLGSIDGTEHDVTVVMSDSPDWARWREYPDGVALAQRYYGGVLPALAVSLGATVQFDLRQLTLDTPWSVRWQTPADSAVSTVGADVSNVFDDPVAAYALMRQTSMNNGALYYFCADEQTRRFDMVGEFALREQCRALGIERARRQQAAHRAAGWDLNLKTLLDNWDGQLVSLWQFAPGGILTEGLWHQDCTVCPYADVWQAFGPRALDLGYLYDMEMHSAYFREYHPDMQVQFAAIKTRGDAVCKFRVSMPSRMRPDEPAFEGYTGEDV